jgi:hypothetical protein
LSLAAAVVKGKDRAGFSKKKKTQQEKNNGRKRGPTKRQRPNENGIGQKQLPTSFSYLPTYVPTYLPNTSPLRKRRKRKEKKLHTQRL